MNRVAKSSLAKWSVVAATAALAQGCAMGGGGGVVAVPETPQATFRQTVETAPADLQLVCAGEAARAYELAPDRVLPISSSVEGETFTVVLNADGAEAICTIDNEGNVLALVRV